MYRFVVGPFRLCLALLLVFQLYGVSFAGGPSNTEIDRAVTSKEVNHQSTEQSAPQEVDREGRFIAYTDSTVKDTLTGLMWAAADNGELIDWLAAKAYCEKYRGGGYTDWRLPTLKELETLYVPNYKNSTPPTQGCSGGYLVNRLFSITCASVWAAEDEGARAASYPFIGEKFWHHRSDRSGQRVLPVRDGHK